MPNAPCYSILSASYSFAKQNAREIVAMHYFAFTDAGSKSVENEDFYALPQESEMKNEKYFKPLNKGLLFVLCDGMGGHNAGEVASQLTAGWLMKEYYEAPLLSSSPVKIITSINKRLCALAREHEQYKGMGTTLVSLVLKSQKATIYNVGDSRCYLYANTVLEQITEDHSEVWGLVLQGAITKDEIITNPRKNIITRAMGLSETVDVDTFSVTVPQHYLFMLCSDGITDVLTDDQMKTIIETQPSMRQCAVELRDAARDAGARDDITLVFVSDWMQEE
jgi:protein phosphatase